MTLNIKISNPIIDDLELTYLSLNISNTVTLNVISSDFFAAPNNLILVGNDKYDNAEVRQIASIAANVITLSAVAKNDHITGEKLRKLAFDKMQLYKKSIADSGYTLLATVDITYNHPQGITVYIDEIGISSDLYKVKYYNSVSTDESDLSDAFSGADIDAGSVYLSITEFRNKTGVSDLEIPDGALNDMLARSTRDLKRYAFAQGREQMINSTLVDGNKRFYFPFAAEKSGNLLGYLTDWNLDGNVDTDDIIVYEKDSNGSVRTDITEQVDALSVPLGYFTLNTGYPSSTEYKIYVTYSWMNFLITNPDTTYDVKNYLMHKTMCYIIEYNRNRLTKGILKQTLGGLTVEKNLFAWEQLYKYHSEEADKYINRFKPLIWGNSSDQSVWMGGGARYYGYGSYYGTGYYDNREPW